MSVASWRLKQEEILVEQSGGTWGLTCHQQNHYKLLLVVLLFNRRKLGDATRKLMTCPWRHGG